jgi:hypothetical protein
MLQTDISRMAAIAQYYHVALKVNSTKDIFRSELASFVLYLTLLKSGYR